MNTDKKGNVKFGRMRFLASFMLSSPIATFVYSPLQAVQTVAGIAVPFATGRFIDSLVGGISPTAPFALLAALLFIRTAMTPCLQRLIRTCERKIELDLQGKVLYAVMDFPPSRLSTLADGSLVAKLKTHTPSADSLADSIHALSSPSSPWPQRVSPCIRVRPHSASPSWRSSRSASPSSSPLPGASPRTPMPCAKGATEPLPLSSTSSTHCHSSAHSTRSGASPTPPRQSMRDLKNGNCALDHLTIAFGAILGAILVVGEVAVLGIVF